jgi:hypothetical protein
MRIAADRISPSVSQSARELFERRMESNECLQTQPIQRLKIELNESQTDIYKPSRTTKERVD